MHRTALIAAAKIALVLLTLAAALSSCVATVQERPTRTTAVVSPPLPLSEPRPPPPAPGMVWAAGYWHWADVQYVWVPGHWESPSFDVAAGSAERVPSGAGVTR